MNSIVGFFELATAVFGIITTLLILLTRLEPNAHHQRAVEPGEPSGRRAQSA